MADWEHFKPGQEIVCVGDRGLEHNLTAGHTYRCLYGTEPGLLYYDRPYVTVVDDNGRTLSCYAHRFKAVPSGE